MLQYRLKDNHKAFTLLEVLIATAILGIMLTGLFLTFSHGFAISSNTRKRLKALHIASSNLDRAMQLISNDFEGFPVGVRNIKSDDQDNFITDNGFPASIMVTPINFLGEVNCKRILSSVGYTENGRNHRVSFATAVYWIAAEE